jgi:hypothetical protein
MYEDAHLESDYEDRNGAVEYQEEFYELDTEPYDDYDEVWPEDDGYDLGTDPFCGDCGTSFLTWADFQEHDCP